MRRAPREPRRVVRATGRIPPPTRSTCSNLRRLTPVSARHVSFDGTPHYMKGGKPGYVPAFDAVPEKLPHWVGLNLWDPFKFTANVPAEKKQAQLVTEINNGRLAMCAATALAPAPPTLTLGRCHSHAACRRAPGSELSPAAEQPSCAMLTGALLAQAGHHGLPVGGQAGGLRAAAQGHHPALRRRGDGALLETHWAAGLERCVCGVWVCSRVSVNRQRKAWGILC